MRRTDLGAGEILLNCIDKDGTNSGFDLDLVADVKRTVRIPVIGARTAWRAASTQCGIGRALTCCIRAVTYVSALSIQRRRLA